MDKTDKLTAMESWKSNLRAWKIWWQMCPGVFISKFIHSAFIAASPYVTIYFSARLLEELAGKRDSDRLLQWIILILAVEAILKLMGGILSHLTAYEQLSAKKMDDQIYMKKMLQLDYADIDRQYVYDL